MAGATLSMIAVAGWLGAAVLFAAVVAPAAFAVSSSRTLAGALVGRILPTLFWSGMVLGVAVGLAAWSLPARPRLGSGAALVLALSSAIAQLVVAPRIARLRERIGGSIEALAPADPMRAAFGRLHAQSVAWLAVGMVSAALVLVVLARPLVARHTP